MILVYRILNIMILIYLILYLFFGSKLLLKRKYLITTFLFLFYVFGILLFTIYSFSFIGLLWTIILSCFWAFVNQYYYRSFCRHKEIERYKKEQEIKARFRKCAPKDIIDVDYKVVK